MSASLRTTLSAANSTVTTSLGTVTGLFSTASLATNLLTNRVKAEVIHQKATIMLGVADRIAMRTEEIQIKCDKSESYKSHYETAYAHVLEEMNK